MKHAVLYLAFATFLTPFGLSGQNATFTRMDSLTARENGSSLSFPAAGGFNLPQFSDIDLNGDNIKDLFVFDRAGNKVSTFLNAGTAGQIAYTHAPQYESAFPTGMLNFALLADYDCDGLEDIFTCMNESGIKVYRNTSTLGNLSFALAIDTVLTNLGAGPVILLSSPKDIPAFVDVDGDTDLDLLTFDSGGSFVEWHKNMSVENHGNCFTFELILGDGCWGKFQEGSLDQSVTLNISCRKAAGYADPTMYFDSRHAGSTVATLDSENDGSLELLVGDLIYDGITYLHNGGSNTSALIDSVDGNWPVEDSPVRLNIFPASYVLDVDNDGKEDVLVSPNADNIAANYDNVLFYKNIHAGAGYTPAFQTSRLIVDEMIDVGTASRPVFFDHNLDGRMDLVIGNYSFKTSASNIKAGLALYENIGTSTAPRFELITRDYAGISSLFNPDIFGIAPAFGDLDGDGDQDMIVGDVDGKLHYFENAALTGLAADFVLGTPNFMGIDVGGFAHPMIVDWNRDGKLDMVIGEWTGKIKYYENTGTAQAPTFSNTPTNANLGGIDVEPVCCIGNSAPWIFTNPSTGKYDLLVGSDNGSIHYYPDAESQTGNFFSATTTFGGVYEGHRTTIASADINGDGNMDWVVGNLRGGVSFYEGSIIAASAQPALDLKSQLSIFPNPSKGILQVHMDLAPKHMIDVSVRDLQGRLLHTGTQMRGGETASLDFSAWADGMYVVECKVAGSRPLSRLWVLAR